MNVNGTRATMVMMMATVMMVAIEVLSLTSFTTTSFAVSALNVNTLPTSSSSTFRLSASTTSNDVFSLSSQQLSSRIEINEKYPNIQKIYSDPDIFLVRNFLEARHCDDLIHQALASGRLQQSPVAYAGWTEDFKDLVELASKGPIAWISLVGAWWELHDSSSASQIDLVLTALRNYAVVFVIVTSLIAAFTALRAKELQSGRTSTSTTLNQIVDGDIDPARRLNDGTTQFVERASKLFLAVDEDRHEGDGDTDSGTTKANDSLRKIAAKFECPTIIRYEKDQKLAPHYDANRSASIEDVNRGGQTLATLLVYLNDVNDGGLTRFGKLDKRLALSSSSLTDHSTALDQDVDDTKLVVQPQRGDGLLFFPADKNGVFDPRMEHEGMQAIDEKWIARIWVHIDRVPPPFGLDEMSLNKL
jgi:hypothetical protein